LHVAANGNPQAERFDGQATEDKSRPRRGRGEEDERGYREKESGWHDQQSGVFHGLSFFVRSTAAKSRPAEFESESKRSFTEGNRL
jgi:hypothetical protein